MVSCRSSPPPNEKLCGDCKAKFESPALKCQTCKIYYHPICAEMPLYYIYGKIRKLKRVICMQTLHGKIGIISLDRESTPLQGLLPQSYRHRKPSRQKWDRCASRNRKLFTNKSFKLGRKYAKSWRHIEYARTRHCARTDTRTNGTWKWNKHL